MASSWLVNKVEDLATKEPENHKKMIQPRRQISSCKQLTRVIRHLRGFATKTHVSVWTFRYPRDGGLRPDAGDSCGCQLADWHHLHPAGCRRGGGRREGEER